MSMETFKAGALVDIVDGSYAYLVTVTGLKEHARKQQNYNPYRVIYTGLEAPTSPSGKHYKRQNDALVQSTVDGSFVFISSEFLHARRCAACGQEVK